MTIQDFQKHILNWDTFSFWMDQDPIPIHNFQLGMGTPAIQFQNWTNSVTGRNIDTTVPATIPIMHLVNLPKMP
jgi:hypothetical protein